jgi:NADPH2:quinone reductase
MAATGGPEVILLTDLPVPAAGPLDVLVRVHAAGVGKPDILVRTGRYALTVGPTAPYPGRFSTSVRMS